MGRRPSTSKVETKKGPWTSQEDKILMDYVRIHGEGRWRDLAQKAGLKRCGKSCRLRWLNYLRPGIKLGNISEDEEDLIIKLHRLLGNRWTLIAGRLPGRSGNEIKNYWNTTLSKKVLAQKNNKLDAQLEGEKKSEHQPQPMPITPTTMQPNSPNPAMKAVKCTKSSAFTPPEQQDTDQVQLHNNETSFREDIANASSSSVVENDDLMSFWMDSDISQLLSYALDRNTQHKEHNSQAEGAIGDYGFSFDVFSNEPWT